MHHRRTAVFIVVGVAIVLIAILFVMRGTVSKRVYTGTGDVLARRLPPELREKYEQELRYTLDKFWSCYESEIVTQNDLNDVMDRMRYLQKRDAIEDEEIFTFIGFVSRIYTDALHEHHRRALQQE
ncbi:MAG TPA: hypothetical protein VMX58_04250 [Patescibacteria group bacterium]|nr:hypothetical protein [Patescibacteria group bacterium]